MNKKIVWSIAVILIVLLAGYLYQTVPSGSQIYTVKLINNDGKETGHAKLSQTNAGVLIGLQVEGLTPNGEHAFHIHETADCTPLATFKNAGGHYNPENKSHGMKHPEGYHAGDMPNLKPDDKGRIETQVLNRSITLHHVAEEDGAATVFDEDGSAIVIHAGADDHISQPSGAAGARIACGVIQK